jgi:hypothetical protein
MRGLDPRIHVFLVQATEKAVDCRVWPSELRSSGTPGNDEKNVHA